jgi:hypothetical protein
MQDTSLDHLKSAVEAWRKNRKSVRDPIPEVLLESARKCVDIFGIMAVVKTTRIDFYKLKSSQLSIEKKKSPTLIKCSKIPLSGFLRTTPQAEVHTLNGIKISFFSLTPDVQSLLLRFSGIKEPS